MEFYHRKRGSLQPKPLPAKTKMKTYTNQVIKCKQALKACVREVLPPED